MKWNRKLLQTTYGAYVVLYEHVNCWLFCIEKLLFDWSERSIGRERKESGANREQWAMMKIHRIFLFENDLERQIENFASKSLFICICSPHSRYDHFSNRKYNSNRPFPICFRYCFSLLRSWTFETYFPSLARCGAARRIRFYGFFFYKLMTILHLHIVQFVIFSSSWKWCINGTFVY